jgi:hypothetical protein
MKYLTLIVTILLIPIVSGLDECKQISSVADVPCQVSATWNYTKPCNTNVATFYNSTGINVANFTYAELGTSSICYIEFNVSGVGNYNFIVNNGDTGNILVTEDKTMIWILLATTISVAFAFLLLYSKTDKEFQDVKTLFFFLGLIFLDATFLLGVQLSVLMPFSQFFIGVFMVLFSVLSLVIITMLYLYIRHIIRSSIENKI